MRAPLTEVKLLPAFPKIPEYHLLCFSHLENVPLRTTHSWVVFSVSDRLFPGGTIRPASRLLPVVFRGR
jgi:hypothetical protein